MEKQRPLTDSYFSPHTTPIDLSKCTRRQCLGIACICMMHLFYLLFYFCNMEENPPLQVRWSLYWRRSQWDSLSRHISARQSGSIFGIFISSGITFLFISTSQDTGSVEDKLTPSLGLQYIPGYSSSYSFR